MPRAQSAFRSGWTVAARYVALLPVLFPIRAPVATQEPSHDPARIVVPLDGTKGLTLLGTHALAVSYRGRKAVEITEDSTVASAGSLEEVALLDGPAFKDGTVEVWVAGTLGSGAAADDRGFIGLAFRSAPDGSRFENIYLRPTNGQADDQLRRNHSTQYASLPDFPWHRLRAESPGRYESYAPITAGAWTHMRIVVTGQRATFFVNDALEPCLIVTDLKMAATTGRIGLWIGHGTRGYFSEMVVTPAGSS